MSNRLVDEGLAVAKVLLDNLIDRFGFDVIFDLLMEFHRDKVTALLKAQYQLNDAAVEAMKDRKFGKG